MDKSCVVSTFDMVNIADLDLLAQVIDRSDEMIVAVLDDAQVEALHGRGPVVGQDERLELVRNLRVTDQVFLCTNPEELQGRDWRLYSDEEGLADLVDEMLTPTRRSASPELINALAHGHSGAGEAVA